MQAHFFRVLANAVMASTSSMSITTRTMAAMDCVRGGVPRISTAAGWGRRAKKFENRSSQSGRALTIIWKDGVEDIPPVGLKSPMT